MMLSRLLPGSARRRIRESALFEARLVHRHERMWAEHLRPEHNRALFRDRVRDAFVLTRAAKVDRDLGFGSAPGEVKRILSLLQPQDVGVPLIRVGGEGDGGYLVPDDLEGVAACYSPGVAGEMSFDRDLADRGLPVRMIDASIAEPANLPPGSDFEPLFLGRETRPGWTSLKDWVERRDPGSADLLLEMDIEGSEWSVLDHLDRQTLGRFRVIVLELHDLHAVTRRSTLATYDGALAALLRDFYVVHVHANNFLFPIDYEGILVHPVIEVTLLRGDRVRQQGTPSTASHPLDRPNTTELPDIQIDWTKLQSGRAHA